MEDAWSCLVFLDLAMVGLLQNQRAIDVVGNADAARLGEGFRILFGQHRAPHPCARGIAERAFALDAAGHLRKHRVEKHRLEIRRRRLGLDLRLRRYVLQRIGELIIRPAVEHRHQGVEGHAAVGMVGEAALHHITSMSAWIAPAALIACRMPIRSRGPMPSPLRPSTSCWSDTPSFTSANFLPSSVTPTREFGVTVVRPRDCGLGWLTCGLSEIVTVRLPCATATVATRTSRPITMMPERSSITILAARSGSTCSCSISVRKATTLPLNSGGIDRFGGLDAEEIVDRGRDALGGGEIGVAQRQPHIGQAVQRELDLAFDDGAIGDAADGRHAADDF